MGREVNIAGISSRAIVVLELTLFIEIQSQNGPYIPIFAEQVLKVIILEIGRIYLELRSTIKSCCKIEPPGDAELLIISRLILFFGKTICGSHG